LRTNNGGWSIPSGLTISYQWQLCSTTGTDCQNITGATHPYYKLNSADVGNEVTVVVTATDTDRKASDAAATPVGPVAHPPPPSNTSLPTISGTIGVSQTLTAIHGNWSSPDPLTYTNQWQRCSSTGTGCENITGEHFARYKPTNADMNHKLTVVVTATDKESQTGQATATPVGPVT